MGLYTLVQASQNTVFFGVSNTNIVQGRITLKNVDNLNRICILGTIIKDHS